ncbi:uncharacterized protein LOC129723167 isoform X2 [Wyeomyia smithii]|uniref:uncharacterized protein LOC129723167 isoform X2 n=1 Tax=Wyeomyia smithii TaxID=174621 RepID=UPI002467B6DB|nr:uncharacterized protein LOC129723167 isoform X2 [Wyeomyia smithii]
MAQKNKTLSLQEQVAVLEQKNCLLEAKIVECKKLKSLYSQNLDMLEANLDALQNLLLKCRDELLAYREQCLGQRENNDPVNSGLERETEALKAQLETYKNDLAVERVAHQALLKENYQLVGSLQQLQQQNPNLIVEALDGHTEQSQHGTNNSSCNKEMLSPLTARIFSLSKPTSMIVRLIDG